MNPDLCGPPPTTGLVASLLANTDCQASSLVERGYSALASPGAATAAMLTSLMVIAVALYGYRLLLGRGLILADVIRLAVQLGAVLLLAASWSSFQGLAYDAVARGPTHIASELMVAIDAPAPLDGIQGALDRIEQGSIGWRTRAGIASPLVGGAPTAAMALNISSFLLTLSTLGLLVVSRILLALLLAITPVIAGFLLFDATLGLLDGWLRAMITAAIIPLFVLILSAIELAILEPLLDHMLGRQALGQFELDDVTPVALVVIIFSLAIVGSIRAAATIARGLRLARSAGGAGVPTDTTKAGAVPREHQLMLVGPSGEGLPIVRALEAAARRNSGEDATRTVSAASRGLRDAAPSLPGIGRRATADAALSPTHRSYLAPARSRLSRTSRSASRRDI